MLSDLQYIISVKQIFSLKTTLGIVITYSSFLARFDQYTDAIFTFKTLTCEGLHDIKHEIHYIGIASTVIMGINLFFSYYGIIYEYILIHIKWKMNSSDLHNTNFINQYTKIALISEFYGVGISLDRFSTSSANNLNYFFIPSVLRNVKIPQIFQSKFQRVFLEDIPMIVILLVYNTYYIQNSWYKWDNLKVILTTILNLYLSLHQAWVARPSIFRTYQMQEYLEFREKHNDIYRLKIYSAESQPSELELSQIKQRVNEFRKKYPVFIIKANSEKPVVNTKSNPSRDNVSESKGKSDNQSLKSGNSQKKESEKSEELHESSSKQSHEGDNEERYLNQNQNQIKTSISKIHQ